MFGLNKDEIDSIKTVFSQYPLIEKVLIYGSRAKGNYRNNSDIDFTIIGKDINLSLLFEIENRLDDLMLPYKIDLSIFSKIENADLVDHINRIGIIFFSREKAK